ncbi:MAG: anti-sigma factor [Roseiflexus sp.]|nr:anti-sigma factor [Roseiflexus sp.]MCS7288230.1 anti-sigma factor [Roseiflexus sp.]MDW8145913.1 anti-sigma factor [Roseiflexaceae bacterium]MDW8232826.1 anti-sigma factor [Roseiflexaceae bacterium]
MTAQPQLNEHDLELLSAYIDGQVSADERRTIERRLAEEAELRQMYEELRATVQALRDLEPLRPPRSFTLDPAKVAVQRPPAARLGWGRLLQVAGVFAAVLVAAIGALNVLGSMGAGAPSVAVQPTAAPATEPMLAAVPTKAPTVAAEARESAPLAAVPTLQPGNGIAAPSSLDNGSGPATPQALATVLVTPEVAALPGVAPQPATAPPAISSPGAVNLTQPTPVAEPATPGGAPDLTLLLVTVVIVALAGGGILLWKRSRG